MEKNILFVPFERAVRNKWNDEEIIHITDVKDFVGEKRFSFTRHLVLSNGTKIRSDITQRIQ